MIVKVVIVMIKISLAVTKVMHAVDSGKQTQESIILCLCFILSDTHY